MKYLFILYECHQCLALTLARVHYADFPEHIINPPRCVAEHHIDTHLMHRVDSWLEDAPPLQNALPEA